MPSLGTAAMTPRQGVADFGSPSQKKSAFEEYDPQTDYFQQQSSATFANGHSPAASSSAPRVTIHNPRRDAHSPSHARSTSLHTSSAAQAASLQHRRDASLTSPSPHDSDGLLLEDRPPRSSSLRAFGAPAAMNIAGGSAPARGGTMGFYERNKGLAYVLLAQVFGVLMNVTTRLLEVEGNRGQGMHPFQILFVRMTITTVLSTTYMWWARIPHFPFGLPEVRWLLLLRSVGGFFGVFGMYYSLLFLPLADATVVTFIAPLVSCFACSVILKEPFTRLEQVGAFISFLGVTLIARPTWLFHRDDATTSAAAAPANVAESIEPRKVGAADLNTVTPSERFGAICVALVGVLGSAMAFTAMRMIGKRAHPLLSVNYFCAWCTVVSALAMAVLPNVEFLLPATSKEWSYLIFLALCGFAMQFLLSAGLQREKSSRATLMVYTQMIFALLFDRLVFGTTPTLLSVTGSTLILGSAIYVALHKESLKKRQQEEEEAEKRRAAERASASSGRDTEIQMQRTRRSGTMTMEEGRGLVNGMDADDDDGDGGGNGNGDEKRNGRRTG